VQVRRELSLVVGEEAGDPVLDDLREVEQRLAAQAQTFHDRRAEALETPG
jgi:hypothetical protein